MKISTDSIQGFAEMSDADKVTALLGLDVPDQVDLSGYVKKEVFDAKATEAANLSKQLKSKMTDDEAAKAQADADRKALEDKYCFGSPPLPSTPPAISPCRAMTRSWPVRQQRRCLTAIWSVFLPTSRKPTQPMKRNCGLIW